MHVAHGEDARRAGLQEERLIGAERNQVLTLDVSPGEQEAVLVHGDVPAQPVGAGRGADEHEQRLGVQLLPPAGSAIVDHDALQSILSPELRDLTVPHYLHAPGLLQFVDEISGHGLAQIVPADQQPAAGRSLRQEQRRLTG